MAELARQGLADGALGFSTSRFYGHLDKQGNLVPGTNAEADEMIAIGDALAAADHGTMEIISDHLDNDDELYWIEHIARQTGRPLTLLVTPENGNGIWELADKLNPEGFNIRPQVGARPASVLMTLEGTLNPMRQFPAYDDIKALPVAEQRDKLRDAGLPGSKVLADEAKKLALSRHEPDDLHLGSGCTCCPTDLSYEPELRGLDRRDRRGATAATSARPSWT